MTVRRHVSALLRKLGTDDRAVAVELLSVSASAPRRVIAATASRNATTNSSVNVSATPRNAASRPFSDRPSTSARSRTPAVTPHSQVASSRVTDGRV